jgi:hypothetical protein
MSKFLKQRGYSEKKQQYADIKEVILKKTKICRYQRGNSPL